MYREETIWCPICEKDTTHYHYNDGILTCGECGYEERIDRVYENNGGEAESRFEPDEILIKGNSNALYLGVDTELLCAFIIP